MQFTPEIKLVGGADLPNNSVGLLYSPSCGYCHQFVPQFNQLPSALRAGGLENVTVFAVDVQQNFSSLKAGGISVSGVPHVIIKNISGGTFTYEGPRMAEAIAQEAAQFLAAGEVAAPALVAGAAPAPVLAAGADDALLGGAVKGGAVKGGELEGGRRRHYMGGGESAPEVVGGELDGGKKRRSPTSKKYRSLKHGIKVKYGLMRSKSKKSRSRGRKMRVRGGDEVAGGEVEVAGGELEGGRRRRRMRGGDEVAGGEVEVAGGEVEGGELDGGKKKSKSRNRWIMHAKKYMRDHGVSYAVALKKGKSSYRKSRKSKSRK